MIQMYLSGDCDRRNTRCACSLCYGIRDVSKDCNYILCMDDDAHLHTTMLQDMVQALEEDPGLFMATGYPFDIPSSKHASLFAYAVLSFHFKLIIPFSFPRVRNVWGGCMLFRRRDLQEDRFGLIEVCYEQLLATVSAKIGLQSHT